MGQELPREGRFMSSSTSGGIFFSGIGSGTDFTELVSKLVEAESYRLYGLEDSRETAMETYEAMTDLISSITEAKDSLTQLNSPSKFLLKLASSSNENLVTAKADSEAVDGNFSVHVQQLASNAIWASKETFASRTTNINPTADTTLTYSYKGQTHTIDVPRNTTLEGLAYMINEDRANPGVKMQIINTAEGYTFQMAGTESGANANLQIQPSSLLGFGSSGSSWETYTTITGTDNIGASQTPSTFTYDMILDDGTVVPSFSMSGDATQQELVTEMNTRAGRNVADIDSATGKLTLSGVKSLTTEIDGTAQPALEVEPTMTGSFAGDLTTPVSAGTYTFKDVDGNNFDVVLTADGTVSDLFTKLGETPGVSITAESDGAGNTNLNFTGITGIVNTPGINLNPSAPNYTYSTDAVATDAIQAGIIPHTFDLNITPDSGPAYAVTLNTGMNYDQMIQAINDASPAGVSAAIDATSGKLVIDGISSLTSSSSEFTDKMNFSGRVTSSDGWTIQESRNAEFKLDNFEQILTSSTNEVTGVIEGVTLSLKGTGTAQISIASDTDSVKANIQTVLDAINSVISKVQDLTAISDDPNSTYVDEDSNTNYNLQGTLNDSALTGEYSVNNFLSRLKDEAISRPSGFQNMTGDDIFSGDLIATLSQMGIKTVTDVEDPNFGLFAIAPSGFSEELQALDQQNFDEALAKNIEDVINFFAADDSGVTSSGDFGYSNHIDGITEPGTYEVSYRVIDAATNAAEVTINGVRASRSSADSNVYTVPGPGPQQGLSITLYDLEYNVEKTGTVSIQRGLVPSMESFFEKELQFRAPSAEDPTIGQNNGPLMIAQNNYKELVDNLDAQIGNELTRLDSYEYYQRMKFARLDTLLGEYNNQMTNLNQQLAQIG